MIQIYSPGNNNFIKNGDAVLLPLQCIVHAELNGAWTMEITHPLDEEGRWKLIEVGAVIKAPSFNGSQLFRIRQTQKQDSGITATAEPIFLDAVGDCFLLDVRPTRKTGQEALDMILANNSKYSGKSDITTKATAYYVRKNALEAIAGEDNSFIERWGGEIIYNNYEIIINERAGGDYGMQILYGKNIPTDGLIESVDMEGVATRIIPKAYNGYILPGSAPWVDSPLINSYPTVMTKVVEYDNIRLAVDVDEEEEDLIICNNLQELYAELRKAAAEEFNQGIDKPTVAIEATLVILSKSPDYQDFKDLEKVSLGDTVHCKHNRLGIVSDARVIALDYDCILGEVQAITIGETQPSFLDRVSSTVQRTEKAITKAGAVKAEQIEGFIDGVMAQLRLQNTIAEKQDVMAILFEDLDPESSTYGALGIGTQGLQISKQRTADDRGWIWTTAATAGGIVADVINAGTLEAIDITGVNITGSTISGSTLSSVNSDGDEGVRIARGRVTVYHQGDEAGRVNSAIWNGRLGAVLVGTGGYVLLNTTTTFDETNGRFTVSDINEPNNYIRGSARLGTIAAYYNSASAILDANNQYMWVKNNAKEVIAHAADGYISLTDGATTFLQSISTKTFSIVSGSNQALLTPGDRLTITDGKKTGSYYNDRITIVNGTKAAFYYNDRIAITDGSSLTWGTQYRANDSLNYGFAVFAGHVTNSTRSVEFFIPLNISAAGRTASIALPSDCSVRTPSGYLNGSQYLTGVTVQTWCLKNGIRVRLNSTTAYTNVSNNQPVSVSGTFNITFTA